jgi:hypothetical protein
MTRICESPTCLKPYTVVLPEQKFCSKNCSARERMRRWRERNRLKRNPPGGGGGNRKQRRLFPKPLLVQSKPVKSAPAQPALFGSDSARSRRKFA